jgi:virginiamycin B lyase
VTLTWSPSSTSWTQSYLVYRAPATSGTPTWTNIGSLAATSCSSTCTYTDSTAGYSQQYLYEVLSVYKSWTSTSATDMALSLQPATGTASTDTTKPGVVERTALPTASSQPGQIAAGGTGDLYFVEQGGNRIGRMNTSGSLVVEYVLNTGWTAWGVTVDTSNSNNVYFTENASSASKVGKLVLSNLNNANCTSRISGGQLSYSNLTTSPCSALTEWTVGSGNAGLRGIAGDASDVYFAEFSAHSIGLTALDGSGPKTIDLGAGTGPTDITIPSFDTGHVYFTELSSGQTGQLRAGGHLDKLATSTAASGSAPWGIVGGPDGNLWFTESGTNNVAQMDTSMNVLNRYSIPSSGASPMDITSGPGGVLWFAESGTGRIGSVTTSGFFDEYATPTAASGPDGVANGPDGSLWFTESASSANRLGSINPSSSSYSLAAGDVANLSTSDSVRYRTNPWAATASTSTYTQAVTFAPTTPVIPSGGAAVTGVKVVLNYQMPAVTSGQSNTSAGLRIGISNNSGTSYTDYALPNPQQSSPTCPTPGGGATESCTFNSPNMQVVLGVPSSVIGNTTQLQGMLVQVQAAPGSGSSFALAFDLVHVDVN